MPSPDCEANTFQTMCPPSQKRKAWSKKKNRHLSLSFMVVAFLDSQIAILPSIHHSHDPFSAFLHISI